MKSILVVVIGASVLSACASGASPVQHGGVEMEAVLPAATAPCEAAGIRLVSEGEMLIPKEAMPALHSTASVRTLNEVSILYDVTSDGRPANIRYGGNPNDFHSDARRELIRAMADQVATFEYSWDGQPSHAVACRYALEMGVS